MTVPVASRNLQTDQRGRSVSGNLGPLERRERAMPATKPYRSQKWYDLIPVIIRSVTTLVVEWMKQGGHF